MPSVKGWHLFLSKKTRIIWIFTCLFVSLQTGHNLVQYMRKLSFIVTFLCTIQALWAESDHNILYDWQIFEMQNTIMTNKTITVSDENIYIGTYFGIVVIDKQSKEQKLINRTNGLTDDHIISTRMIDGSLWYGGLKNGFGVIKDGEIKNITRSMAPFGNTAHISAIEKDKDGNLWVGTISNIYKFTNGEYAGHYPFFPMYSPTTYTIYDVFADDDGTIWVSGGPALGLLDGDSIRIVYSGLGVGWGDILKDHHGDKWMAAQEGLIKFDKDTFTEYRTDAKGESLERLGCLTEDKDGNFWAFRDSFLVKYDGTNMESYNLHHTIRGLALDGHEIYMVTDRDELLKYHNGVVETSYIKAFSGKLPSDGTMSRGGCIDHEGNYLAGTTQGGLLKLKPDGTCIKINSIKQNYITETVSDKNGDIWVACNWTPPFRLYKIIPSDTITYNTDNSSPLKGGEEIFQMAVDHHNRLWIASDNGLHCFDGNNWQTYNKDNSGLTTNRVYCVAFDKEGRLWTSCGKGMADYLEIGDGLFCYDGKVWQHYVSKYEDVNGFADRDNALKMPIRTNSIGYIAIDDNNTFWLAVNYNDVYYTTDIDAWHGGVIRWDGKDDWRQFMSPYNGEADPSVPTYTPGEWINNIEFVLPGNWVNSIDFDRYGRVWLGFEGNHGIAMYDGKDFTVWDMDVPGIAYGSIFNLCIDRERDRIWMNHPYENGASFARIRSGETDGMRSLPNTYPSTSGKIFNLSGKQILQPKRGELFIKGGKKYFRR